MLILLLILVLIIAYYFYYKKEHFDLYYGVNCENCSEKTFGECIQCANCGFGLVGNNKGFCTRGDMLGPYKSKYKFKKWLYNDPFWRQNKKIIPAFTE